jgi:anti-sigma B factor antagonist
MGIALHIGEYTPDHAVVVRASGEVDMVTAPELESSMRDACARAAAGCVIVLDLGDVRFLGAAGLGVLVRVREHCHRHGHPFRVVATHRAVLRPIAITGVDREIEVVSSVAEALGPDSG